MLLNYALLTFIAFISHMELFSSYTCADVSLLGQQTLCFRLPPPILSCSHRMYALSQFSLFSPLLRYIGNNAVLYRVVAAAMKEVETCMMCGKTFSEGRGMGSHLVTSTSCSKVYKNPPSSFTEHSSALRAHNRRSWNEKQQSPTHESQLLGTGNILEADNQNSGVSDDERERGPARASGSIPNLAGDDDDGPYFEEEDPNPSAASGEVDDQPSFSGDEEDAIMDDDVIAHDTSADGVGETVNSSLRC
jgi:hypothetical protein